MSARDGHVRVLPIHVANKIAAGEVVERPASVAKELIENAIDAGAKTVKITVSCGGRKLVSVQDDGCGMTRDDAVLSLERQATSKILDVNDIENIVTLGFRGEAIPSIASVSRFSITTRRHDNDEGTFLAVNAGTLAEVRAAGCPAGTLVEVRDLFCNVPARKKFLRSAETEEAHIRAIFTDHALAHPAIGFSLVVDTSEIYRLAPAKAPVDRVREIFGAEFCETLNEVEYSGDGVSVTGFIERADLATPTRHDQHIFVNGRPASTPSIARAIKDALPRTGGDYRPAAILFISVPPNQVDVNVHPTKREVRFRNNAAVRTAIINALGAARPVAAAAAKTAAPPQTAEPPVAPQTMTTAEEPKVAAAPLPSRTDSASSLSIPDLPKPQPVQVVFDVEPTSTSSRPWKWSKFLAQSSSGYLLVETDSGIVTINPHAARERIAYEKLLNSTGESVASQALLIPETVQLPPVDAARIKGAFEVIRAMGFQIEEFGRDTFKIDAVPQLIGSLSPRAVLSTVARDLADGGSKRGERWREELIAKSIARSFAGSPMTLTAEGADALVEELCACRMPYICPRGKKVMLFTSTTELNRKFER